MEGATGEYVSGEPKVNGERVEWGTAGKPERVKGKTEPRGDERDEVEKSPGEMKPNATRWGRTT
jgi:hypothetical protein